MNNVNIVFNPRDNGGRRVGIERRAFSYSSHIPERRHLVNRRIEADRRLDSDRRKQQDERRNGMDRRMNQRQAVVIDLRNDQDRRQVACRRSGMDRRDFIIV